MKSSFSLALSVVAVVAAGTLFSNILGQLTPRAPTVMPTGTAISSSARSSVRSSSRVSTASIPGYSNCYYLILKTGSCYDASQQRTPYDATRDICKRNPGEWCDARPNTQNNPNGFCDAMGNCIVANSSSYSSTATNCAGTAPACNGACSSGYRCGLMGGGCLCYRVTSSSASSTVRNWWWF